MARRRGPVFVPRYCGNIKIGIRYRDREDDYECRLSKGRESLGTLHINPAKAGWPAVDSAAAYDRTARSAISFASYDGDVDEMDLDYDESGEPAIRRMPPR